jgi:hypothetical protein
MTRLKKISTKSQSMMGLLTLVCGFLMMWGSSRGTLENTSTMDKLRREAVDIDPLFPDPKFNGALVVAAGKLSATQLLEDEFLKPSAYLVLRRRVEMYQWIEELNPIDPLPQYKMEWIEGQVDFFTFKQVEGHANPLLSYSEMKQSVAPGTTTFGGFDATRIVEAVRKLLPITVTREMLKDNSLRVQDGKIVIPRNATAQDDGPALGDVRIWYEGLPQGEYTILARQIDERNLVGSNSSNSLEIRPGVYSAETLFSLEATTVQRTNDGLLFIGGLLFGCGLFSLLLPTAQSIDLRPRLNVRGVPALAVLCAVLSVAAIFLFFVLGRLF